MNIQLTSGLRVYVTETVDELIERSNTIPNSARVQLVPLTNAGSREPEMLWVNIEHIEVIRPT